jgi:hypothetical protein
MHPIGWYLLGILPYQGIPSQVGRYVDQGLVPTPESLAAGTAGSFAVGTAISLWKPNMGHIMSYHKLRVLGFQFQASSSYWSGGPIWRMPLWARATGWGLAAYGIHHLYTSGESNATAALPGNRFKLIADYLG